MKKAVAFRTESAFRRKLEAYFDYCAEQKRIPNIAGFCVFCSIRREDYFALRSAYPLRFDIAQSLFVDAAVNLKVPNTGTSLDYLLSQVNGISLDEVGYDIDLCDVSDGE